ncbi:hypothetical protein DENSPDRAFT_744315, partial [Dentipellis sp. KUC8613]
PEWMAAARSFLETGSSAKEWLDIIEKWATCDCLLGHPPATDHKHWMTTVKHPEKICLWIQRGRKYTDVLPLGSTLMFGRSWRQWWVTVQPAWRAKTENQWPLKRDDVDGEQWKDIAKGGANGLFMVLLPLVWW